MEKNKILFRDLIPSKYELKHLFKKILIALKNLIYYKYPFMFTRIEIDIYNVCNRRCSYCPNSKCVNKPHKMEESLFYKIIDQLSEINYRNEITLHRYGEPLLDDRLEKFVHYIRKKLKFAFINLHTNGDFLDYSRFKSLLNEGVNFFTITQHSNKLSKENLDLFKNISEKERKNIQFQMGAQLYLNNRGGILESVRKNQEGVRPCFEPRRNLVIDSYGRIVICCNDYFSSAVLGDLNKNKLMEVWKSRKYNKLRTELARGNRSLFKICSKCDI